MHRPAGRALLAAVGLLLAASTACTSGGPGGPVAAPTSASPAGAGPCDGGAVRVRGRTMRYVVGGDTGAAEGRERPVLLLLHAAGSEPEQALSGTGLDRPARAAGVLVVAPEGTGSPRGWVTFSRAGLVDTLEVPLLAVLDDVAARGCGRADGVVAVGVSNGAAMAGLLGCVADGRVAAVVMVAGTVFPGEDCDGTAAVSVLAVHGEEDHVFEGFLSHTPAGCCEGLVVWPPADAVAGWGGHDGCGAPVVAEPAPGLREERRPGCRGAAEVELLTLAGTGHTWPAELPDGSRLVDRVLALTGPAGDRPRR